MREVSSCGKVDLLNFAWCDSTKLHYGMCYYFTSSNSEILHLNEVLRKLQDAYSKEARAEEEAGQYNAAGQSYEKSITLLEYLITELEDLKMRRIYLQNCLELGEIYKTTQTDDAKMILQNKSWVEFCEKVYSDQDSSGDLVVKDLNCYLFCRNIVEIFNRQKDFKAAKQWLGRALAHIEAARQWDKCEATCTELKAAYESMVGLSKKCGHLFDIFKYKRIIKELKR